MELLYYVELKDKTNSDEWSNKLDFYGYSNEVLIMGMGYCSTIPTPNIEGTTQCINDIVSKLINENFVLLNKEDKTLCRFNIL